MRKKLLADRAPSAADPIRCRRGGGLELSSRAIASEVISRMDEIFGARVIARSVSRIPFYVRLLDHA